MRFSKLFKKSVLGIAIVFLVLILTVGPMVTKIFSKQMAARAEMLDGILDIENVEDLKVIDANLNLSVYDLLDQIDNVLANDL